MITNPRESDFTTKQEKNTSEEKKISKASSSSSTPWSRLRSDPRIVRVSRAFGGKDRHSKVCTVKGLRDRRVRLSVPTAIQLYDLQDRLGLNQPSKVVDWLLNAAKHEIDELPPLQIPPGNIFTPNHQLMLSNSQSKEGLNLNTNINWDIDHQLGLSRSSFWSSDATNLREKSKEVAMERDDKDERENWKKKEEEEEEEKQGGTLEGNNNTHGSSNFFPRPNINHSSLPSLINNFMPHNSFYRFDPSNFSFSHLGGNEIAHQTDQELNTTCNVVPLSLPSGSTTQVLFCPPQTTQPYFPSNGANYMEFDPKQINNFQMFSSNSVLNPLSSSNSTMRPFHLSMTPKLFPSQNNINQSHPNKD